MKKVLSLNKITPDYKSINKVIALSIGHATKSKIKKILQSYNQKEHYLIGGFIDNHLIAIIGIYLEGNLGVIKHLAVVENYRRQGIAWQLIKEVIHSFSLKQLKAETDDEAVRFYQQCGFRCYPIVSPYRNRYECLYSLDLN
ncbi:GNAT family N-acetyltransferase [Legionella sp. D16C41]|uniref:GNAT family N-acetyltransferase n=1 Tax=Legionella sp. D16C41 TaxID=3402688 RepID=UPI003AF5042B